MIAFPLFAAVTLPALVWRGAGKSLAPWLLAWAAFVAAIVASQTAPLVVFLGLFLVPALVAAFLLNTDRVSPAATALFALSDLMLALALTAAQSAGRRWALPEAGGWEEGALFLAAAAALRLGGAVSASARDAAFTHLGWWQGLFLAAQLGDAAPGATSAAAVLIWALVARAGWTGSLGDRSLAVAGGAACLAVSMGATAVASLVAIGVGGSVLALGHQAIGGWMSLVAPISIAALASPAGSPGVVRWASMAALPLAWAGAARTVAARPFAAPNARGILPFVAAASAFWALKETTEILWLIVLAAGSGLLVWTITSRSAENGHLAKKPVPPLRQQFSRPVVWASSLMAAALWLRLLLVGLSTGFL